MHYRAYINFSIQQCVKNCKKKPKPNNKQQQQLCNFFFCSPLCVSNYLSYNKLFWIRLRILPYFSCDLFVLREFKGKMIHVRLSEANQNVIIIDHRRLQNVVRTSVTHLPEKFTDSVTHSGNGLCEYFFCFYNILMLSVIYSRQEKTQV